MPRSQAKSAPSSARHPGLADVPAPGPLLLALEFRAFWEFDSITA